MKKRTFVLLLTIVMFNCMNVCGNADTTELETNVIRVAYTPSSGQVFGAIAEDKKFYEDEGITVEMIPIPFAADAFAALTAGHVDILSTYGTNRPLQYIAAGEDVSIFAGYMINGAMSIVARKGTGYNGIQDFVGKTIAGNLGYYALTGPMLDAGYDPAKEITWIDLTSFIDRMTAVTKGEADYAVINTGALNNVEEMGLEVVCFLDDLLLDYSCCRVVARTSWLKENPNATIAFLRAWLRAQEVLERDLNYAVTLTAKQLDVPEEYASTFMRSPHYNLSLDPYKSAVLRAWNYMDKLSLLSSDVKIDINDHVNTALYKRALDEFGQKYAAEAQEFYNRAEVIYQKNNQ